MLPQDPIILFSYVNAKLRDRDENLAEFCRTEDVDEAALCAALAEFGYEYNADRNQFV